ncbi:hypothetical protein BD626DRAFT_564917 [Schizophyllum amplum]|uniref:Uncharacterized protein n=1 Tax=Schizophyllum amplum TaxID=97359 RepID=A0A550CTD5_9AGAR|nr:hypothetical protein BD626DRAFT_564917 [Auriculariopsis ampla]
MSYRTPSHAQSHRSHSRSHSRSYQGSPYGYDPNNAYQYQQSASPYYAGQTQPSMGMPMPQGTVYQNQAFPSMAQTQPSVIYTPSSHRSHRHGKRHSSSGRHHRHHSEPVVMSVPTVAPTMITSGSHRSRRSHSHGHRRHHSQPHYQYVRKDTFGEKLKRFFGFGTAPGVKHESKNSSWGFLGHSKRRRYIDLNTGMEVDRRGRPIMRI